ncbi:MAG: hypothetical protein WBA13_07180 [Microcoleaceae cyanobacterium]
MLRTWTDTHYQLETDDWLYITTHDELGSASLVCPGYSRDGEGFSIHFTSAHTEILERLVTALQSLKTQQTTLSVYPTTEVKPHLIR